MSFTSSAVILPSHDDHTMDGTPEHDVLAKITGALAVLEHRRGSALIPATCAQTHHMHETAAAPSFSLDTPALHRRAATCELQYGRQD